MRPWTSARRAERLPGQRSRAACTASGRPPPAGAIPSSCSRRRRRRASRSSCPSATGACSSRRSPSTAARPTVMAADLASEPRTGLHVQLCGDAHLSNFGVVRRTGPAHGLQHQRLRRDASGAVRVGREAARRKLRRRRARPRVRRRQRHAINLTVTRAYRGAMADFAAMRTMDLWYTRLDVDDIAARWSRQAKGKVRKRFERNVAKARTKDSLRAFGKLTHLVDGEPRIASDPPLIVPIEDAVPPEERERARSLHARGHPLLPPDPGRRPPAASSSASATSTRRARSSGSAAWARARGSSCCSAATTRTRCSCRPRRRRRRCSSRRSARARSPTTASASSRASDCTQAASDIMLGWLSLDDPLGVRA